MSTRQSISSPSTRRGPPASFFKKASRQEAERKATIIRRTQSASSRTSSGGTIIVTKEGKVTEKDSTGQVLRQFQTTQQSAERFILGQTATINRQLAARQKQKALFEKTSNLLKGRVARSINVAPGVSTRGVANITVTSSGRVTEKDSAGQLIRRFNTDKLTAAKFIAQPEIFTPDKLIPKQSVDPDFLKERDFSVQVKHEGLLAPSLRKLTGKKGKLQEEKAKIQEPLTLGEIKGLAKQAKEEGVGVTLKKFAKERSLTPLEQIKLQDKVYKEMALAIPIGILNAISIFTPKGLKQISLTVKEVRKAGIGPSLINAGTSLGTQFLISPEAMIVEFIAFSQTLGIAGKGIKSLGIGTKLSKALYLNRIPKVFRAVYTKVLNSAKASRVIKAAKLPAKVSIIKAVSTASRLETAVMRGVLRKFGGVIFKTTKTGSLDNIAISNLRSFSSKFLKALPKPFRKNYVIRNGLVFNKKIGKFVFNSKTISTVAKTRTLNKFVADSLNKVLFKATGKILKVKLKPGLKASLVRIGTSRPIRIINLGTKRLSNSTIRSLSKLADTTQNLGAKFSYIQIDSLKVIQTISAPVIRRINKIISDAAAFPSRSKSLIIEIGLKINRALKKFNIKIQNLKIKAVEGILRKVNPIRAKLIDDLNIKLAKFDLNFQIKKLKFNSKFRGLITQARNVEIIKDVERLARLLKKSKNKLTIQIRKTIGRINKPLDKFYNIKLVVLKERAIKQFQITRAVLNNKQKVLARRVNIIVDSTNKSIKARVDILKDELLDVGVRYKVSFELQKRFAKQSLNILTQKAEQGIIREFKVLRGFLIKSEGLLNKQIRNAILNINKKIQKFLPGKIVVKRFVGKIKKGISRKLARISSKKIKGLEVITKTKFNIVKGSKVVTLRDGRVAFVQGTRMFDPRNLIGTKGITLIEKVKGLYNLLGIRLKIKLSMKLRKVNIASSFIRKELKKPFIDYYKQIVDAGKITSKGIKSFSRRINNKIKRALPIEVTVTTPTRVSKILTGKILKRNLKKALGLTNKEKLKIGKLFDPTIDLGEVGFNTNLIKLRGAVKQDLLKRALRRAKVKGISLAKAKRIEVEALARASKKALRLQKVKSLSIRQQQKVIRKAQELAKQRIKEIRISTHQRKIIVARQNKAIAKIKRGVLPKAGEKNFVMFNGKKTWQLWDLKGNLKRFTSRKKWISELKRKIEAQVGGRKFKETPELLKLFKDKRELGINVINIKGGVRIFKKGKLVIEVKKAPVGVIKKVSRKIINKAKKTGGKQIKIIKPKDLSKEIKGVGNQILLTKKETIKVLKKAKEVKKGLSKFFDNAKTKSILGQREGFKATRIGGIKATRFGKQLLFAATKIKSRLDTLQRINTKRKSKLKSLLLFGQRQMQISKTDTKQISITKQAQKLLQESETLTDTITASISDIVSDSRIATKIIQEYKLSSVYLTKQIEPPKEIMPPILLLTDFQKKLNKELLKRLSKRKFIYIPDLYSNVLNIRANVKEKKAFLRKGAIFTGTEIRKLVI